MNKNKNFKYYQPNEKDIKDEYGDCVLRALTKAVNKTWLEVFDELIVIAREVQAMPNNKHTYEKYLVDIKGFTYKGISNKKGSKRPSVTEFAKEHRTGTYVVRLAHHIVTIVDGIYYDTWDSGNEKMYGYWEK